MINYRNKYLRTYFWQAISILLGFSSLFIVVPHLSSNRVLYGIYSVCTSLTIFFSYADLGFLSAGVKYAAEFYIRGDYKNEMKVIGFTAFFMILVFTVVAVIIMFIGFTPTVIIPELVYGSDNYRIAQILIFTLAIGCPLLIAQRIIQIIFSIRVEDYKYQRILIFASCIRILSIFFFFSQGRYLITEYYIFYQIVSLGVIVISLLKIRKYGYKFLDFIKAFRFNKAIFDREKSLSSASFLFMISMILYNELDQIAISNFFGVESVALYATAFSFMTFVRSFTSLVYSPYSSRYNHFVGLNDFKGLVDFTQKILVFISPFLIIPIINIALYSKPFIISWVGEQYAESAVMMSLMVMSYVFNSMTNPLTSYMTACEKNKKIVMASIIMPFVYWVGVAILSHFCEVTSFAIMKFFAPASLLAYYWPTVIKDIKKHGYEFIHFSSIIVKFVPSLLASLLLSLAFYPIMRETHDKSSLLFNILIIMLATFISLIVALIFDKKLKLMVNSYIKTFICRNKI